MKAVHAVLGQGPKEEAPVAADRVRQGSPRTVSVLDYERDGKIFAGEWSASVGAWSVTYDEWEFCHVLEGVCELETADGERRRFAAGDSFIIEPGFVGVWRVLEPMKKRFVVRYG
ncbi:MAG: cupin domain-containing protein [Hyphomonadaceae bacterium]